jgi:ribonuclease HIII
VPAAKYTLKQPHERQEFKQALQAISGTNWSEKTEQYCDYRMDGSRSGGWLRAKQFTNGTLYLEASTEDLLSSMTVLLGQAPVSSGNGKSSGNNGAAAKSSRPAAKSSGLLDVTGTYIGTDESGKGDYFGPLVIAGVLVTDETCAALRELGVMDSKKLTDQRIGQLRNEIAAVVGEKAIVTIEIGPAKYNELYQRFKSGGKNLNHLLAWGHATAIENLLARFPDCTQAIADQFGDERYILSQLKDKGRGIVLKQTPRAEANVGVAAASIVARQRFTSRIQQLSNQFGIQLPMGASSLVKDRARQFIAAHGREALGQVAKLHFKTTLEL